MNEHQKQIRQFNLLTMRERITQQVSHHISTIPQPKPFEVVIVAQFFVAALCLKG